MWCFSFIKHRTRTKMRKMIFRINQRILNGVQEIETPFFKGWLVYLPILILLMYIGMGYISYLICPVEWPLRYDLRTAIYMLLIVSALLGGYLFSVRKKATNVIIVKMENHKFYNILLIVGAILYIPSSYYKTGFAFPTILSSLIDPGVQYYETIKIIGNRPAYYNLLGMGYIITYAVVILTYFYWDQLVTKQRIFGGILAFLYMLIEMSSGKNIGTVILGISILVCYFSKICKKSTKKKIVMYTLFTVVVMVLMCFLFVYNLKSRTRYSVENEIVYEQNLNEANELVEKKSWQREREK